MAIYTPTIIDMISFPAQAADASKGMKAIPAANSLKLGLNKKGLLKPLIAWITVPVDTTHKVGTILEAIDSDDYTLIKSENEAGNSFNRLEPKGF